MKTPIAQLKNGSLVEMTNGEQYIFIKTKEESGFIDPENLGHMPLSDYDSELKLKSRSDSEWDIVKFTVPLGLVGLKMKWEKSLEDDKKIAWRRSGIDFGRPAILRQEWTPICGTPNYRIVETNGCHAGVMFEGFVLFDSSDLDLEPMQFNDNFAKPDKGDPDNYKLKLVKYI